MALRLFKKEQKKESPREVGENAGKVEKAADTDAPKASTVRVGADSQLVRAHITEKATDLAGNNQYVFVVRQGASKKEVERSVEKAYGVNVKGVRIINVRSKAVRLGRTRGIKSGYKKAIVHIREGQSIDILPS